MSKNPFADSIDAFTLNFDKASEETVRATAIKTWGAIIKDTPVDEGRARANWFATGAKPSVRKTDSEDLSKDGANTALNAAVVVDKLKDWSVFTLTNNLPYIEKLEFGGYGDGPNTAGGYSRQAPEGMVRVNIARSSRLLEEEAKKRFKKL